MAQEIVTDRDWGVKAFPRLTPEQRGKIKSYVTRMPPFQPGAIICKEGAKGHTMFFIESGTVRFYTRDLDDKELFIRNLGPGDFFGEIALLTGGRRSVTAQATDTVVAWELHEKHFDTFLRYCPEMTKAMLVEMAHRLRTSGYLFANVKQEIEDNRTPPQRMIQTLVGRMGTLGFVIANLVGIAIWIGYNWFSPHPPDSREYGGLGLVATCEALIVALLVLAKQNRDEADNNTRAAFIARSLKKVTEKLLEEDKKLLAAEEKIEAEERQILDQLPHKADE